MTKPKLSKNIQVPDSILKELLTPSEIRMLKNRFQILKLLEEGLTIRNIAQQVKVGTDTVIRVSKMGIRRKKATKAGMPWIFGKSNE